MKRGDQGPAVLAYQRLVGLRGDSFCGWDTETRWRADNDVAMPSGLRRMARLIGVVTRYQMGADLKDCTDCSGAVCRALSICKAHGRPGNPTALDFGTAGILADALGAGRVFGVIPLPNVVAGDLVAYGPRDGHAGHIAFVVDPAQRIILDCSASQNGVHAHPDILAQFWIPHSGRPVYGLRFCGNGALT